MLPLISDMFFPVNQVNYARWLTLYYNNLLKVEESHPGLLVKFQQGSFGVKRTDKCFSRQPVDLVLKQTVNADASGKVTGIKHFANSNGTKQRWYNGSGLRPMFIAALMEDSVYKKREDRNADLQESRIRKSKMQMDQFMAAVENNAMPFAPEMWNDKLFNICTGQAAPDEVADYLLGIRAKGRELRHYFIRECSEDDARLESTIARVKVANFASVTKKKKVKIAGKLQEVTLQKDLFGRLMALSLEHTVDLDEVFRHPVTPTPSSLCHADGTINKTDNAALLKFLEREIDNPIPPTHSDVYVVDGFFFVHLFKDLPKGMSNTALRILQKLCTYEAPRIDIVFDRYFEPSIKDNEHILRNNTATASFVIRGANQERPTNFPAALRNIGFKKLSS